MTADLDTRPVGRGDLSDLARLFGGRRSTRRCWCAAFCTTSGQFARGWFGAGNRRRFETMASTDSAPMGVIASVRGEPVGWCACGPRSRYTAALRGRSRLLRERDRTEDDSVWLLPCTVVAAAYRGRGITSTLVRAAVALARQEGASAVEGWPLARSAQRPAEGFLGREEVFEELGFRCVARPSPHRAIMRLELSGD